jgi:hypothetical protein
VGGGEGEKWWQAGWEQNCGLRNGPEDFPAIFFAAKLRHITDLFMSA